MKKRELRKMNRRMLLEMLLEQSKEMERMEKELNEAKRQLEERRILIEESGSIAEAAMKLNHVFAAAQGAADLYLENVRRLSGGRNEEK